MTNKNKILILLLATTTLVACAQVDVNDSAEEEKAEQTKGLKETTGETAKQLKQLEEDIEEDIKKAVEEIEKEIKEGIDGVKETADKVKGTVEKAAEDIVTKVKTYIVKEGDSLWSIAKDVLKDISLVDKLHEMNKDIIPDKNVIQPGQVLKLPE